MQHDTLTKQKWISLISKGIRAPSADNLQPWKFQLSASGRSLSLFLDRDKVNHYCDYGLYAPYLSVGAVIENIRVAAFQLGYELHIHYFPDRENMLYAADLSVTKLKSVQSAFHFDCLDKRATNRKFYQFGKKIPAEHLTQLSDLVLGESNYQLLWVTPDDPRYSELCRQVGEADQLRFEIKRLHDDLISILRLRPQEANDSRDGLDVRSLESGPLGPLMFQMASKWPRMVCLNALGLSRFFNQYAQVQMRSSSASGLIVASSRSAFDFLRGGEVMEKLWHECSRLGLSIQPMEALPIFILNLQQNETASLSHKQLQRLEKLKARFLNLFHLNDEYGLVFLFRIGYATPSQNRSQRRPVETFISESTHESNIAQSA